MILDGKKVAEDLKQGLAVQIIDYKKKYGSAPMLKVIIVGDDKASQVYVRNKHLACEKVGMESEIIQLPRETTQSQLLGIIEELNRDENVDGILVQLPIPPHINKQSVFKKINPYKDVDGMTYLSTGLLWSGIPLVSPCTPSGVIKILKYYNISIKGTRALVIGRSQIVGRPMTALLLEENATVTVAHSASLNIRQLIEENEIIVVAAGKPEFLGKADFKPYHYVIDVGIHGSGSGKLCGDVKFQETVDIVKGITPVPGGVGPMTIACLLENTLILSLKRKNEDHKN